MNRLYSRASQKKTALPLPKDVFDGEGESIQKASQHFKCIPVVRKAR